MEAACPNTTGLTSESKQGILITVQSSCNDYSAMSYIIDEIDDIINDMYPGEAWLCWVISLVILAKILWLINIVVHQWK